MLLSELEERERRFKLALRAGIPILLLVGLIVYIVFLKEGALHFTTENYLLLGSVIFISIYFIYFLLEQDAEETLLDHATHGFNQKAFERKLKHSGSKTIALLTIDNLYLIDENYGTQETNRLLYHIVHSLDQALHENDLGDNALIGRRFGADFLIAIDKKSDELALVLKRFFIDNHIINNIDISYKYALMTYRNENFKKTVSHLKDALHTPETDRRNKEKHKDKKIQDVDSLIKLEKEISSAIEAKKLSFVFRPLQNTLNGRTDIYEVSVKLRTDTFGEVLPRVFLPIANRLGLGREYDFAIMHHMAKLLPLTDEHISLAFNISPFSMRNKGFQDRLFSLLEESKVNASRLIVELYERKVHHDLSAYFQTLGYLRSKGLRIAIDNFGSSDASMEYIKHFRFDMVQFDREYTIKLNNKATHEMFHSLVSMSKNLGIVTVAKWVDDDTQKSKLKALGIEYIQGFGVGKALLEKELIERYN